MFKAELIVGGALVGLVALGYLAAKKAGALPGVNTFNPLSDQNLAYRGATSIYQYVTGNNVDTLGTSLASGYSDAIGVLITQPVPIFKPPTGEGLSYDEFFANAVPNRANVGAGGAAYPLPRKA